MRRLLAVFFVLPLLCFPILTGAAEAGTDNLAHAAAQMVVCLAPDKNSWTGSLQLFDRDAAGKWRADGDAWPVLFGIKGLAWGRGINPPQPGLQKKLGDHRNPEGVFKIGPIYGCAPALPDGSHGWPYHAVTDRDAWIDDPALADLPYNHLYTLPPGAALPAWWDKEHMHLGDSAYEWLVLIEHNYDNPVPDAGNEIFFHVRRGEHYRTAGCTTMDRDDLKHLVKWLHAGSNALVAELTRADYERFWQAWGLPPAQQAFAGATP
jgi:L,D-peptidoglycan transpeptidase YkuD (ErfK/YbiS/YcfS/YnhG family)